MMDRMRRRDFVLSALAALAAPRTSLAASTSIEILPDEPIGVISPNIYGHFTEHIGGVIYDGVWVGEKSKVPNVGGVRKALVDHLRAIKAPVIRWPGGCFADSYNWRDGIGPREKRPTRTNFWANTPYLEKAPNGPQKYEPNEYGTNEYARFCQLAGAEPYIAGNVRSLNPYDFYEWIEYCNSPAGTTTLAEIRAQGGQRDPINVRYWGVGNESWGCGGNFTGAEYAVEFRRWVEWVPRYNVPLSFIASGPNVADYSWTRTFFEKLTEKNKGPLKNVFGLALHYYCGGAAVGSATKFSDQDWYKLISDAGFMETLVRNHWQIMGETDTAHTIKLVVDEWGAWHQTDPNISPEYLWAYWPSLRDALVSGITLDIFNNHADKVTMANSAQLINNINASFVGLEDKFITTPIYEIFRLYMPHQGGTAVRAVFEAPTISAQGAKNLGALSGSCSMQGNHAVLTVVNPDIHQAQETAIQANGKKLANVSATVLTAADIHAHNTFDQPNAVQLQQQKVQPGSPFVYPFAPASVTRLEFDLS